MTAIGFMPYETGEQPYSLKQCREEVVDYAGAYAEDYDIDAVVKDYAAALEAQLGPGWSIGYDAVEHPEGLSRDEAREEFDFAVSEVELAPIFQRHDISEENENE